MKASEMDGIAVSIEHPLQRLGAHAVLLEVGTRNTDAQVLYRRGGYQSCGPFSPYATSPISLFMRRPLD
jgi:putative acetyltransferase